MRSIFQSLFADPDGRRRLIRRLLIEHAAANWRRYVLAFCLMLIAAARDRALGYPVRRRRQPGLPAQELSRDLRRPVRHASWSVSIVKGMATYGSAVQLARIGNRIIAENERRMFDKLLNESLGFFATGTPRSSSRG